MESCKECGNPVIENRDTMLCASCASYRRKAERLAAKEKKIAPIRKVSVKQGKALKTYAQLRDEYMKMHPMCQARLVGCTYKATEIHHQAKRGEHLNDSDSFLAVCHACHHRIETVMSAAERRERGFLR